MYKRSIRKNETMKPFIVVLLVITIGAVIVGYFGTRYVVYPFFIKDKSMVTKQIQSNSSSPEIISNDQNKNTANETTNNMDIINTKSNQFIVYNVQLGNFSTEENASALIEDLKKENIYAYILKENGYKVVTSPVTGYSKADVDKNKVKDFSEDAFVLKRKVYSENKELESAIQNILNHLYQAKIENNGEKYLEQLSSEIKNSIDSKGLEQETVQVFQSMYDEVNKENYKKELFELEKMIIMKIEEII